jgi:hypothetical protein
MVKLEITMNVQQHGWSRDLKRERAVVMKVREVSGDAVWIVEGRTREMLAKYKLGRDISLNQHRWRRRMGPKRYELQTPHGEVYVKEHYGAWFVVRGGDYAVLVHAADDRDAIFIHLDDAQAAAELYMGGDDGARRSTDDALRWQEEG